MTQLRHIAWYMIIIASIYAANGKRDEFLFFSAMALIIYVASFFERKE